MKNLFSIGFEKYNIDNLNNDELIKHCQDTYTPTNKTTNFDSKVLNLLKSIFLSQGQLMVKELLGTDKVNILQIDRIWGNVDTDESIIVPHTHKTSLLSGVYYLTPGKLTFLNPYQVLSHIKDKEIENYNEYNSDHRFINMNKGDMVIFNSSIYHFAAMSKENRLSIACDMSLV